jgi:hypothetical protein
MIKMKKILLNYIDKILACLICLPLLPILIILPIVIWIDWKRNYEGLPFEAWGMPHPHE